ncbi:sigma-70 family RNA polymerase sigma factor [Chitinophaga sp. 212800010-3]|uniref:RNA polymerase sigma factor n=1 Tax=unclassified Chitinophaga TaxID=2619133 RepID=UPI002DE490D0|nr:RNA polymerase sigma-70 factor, ECF subfamily [Chitinophaga sp. 212800010-3]
MQPKNQDAVLLDQLKEGNSAAFTAFYNKFHRCLLTLAMEMLKDEELAKDLLQEFFLDFWQRKLFMKIDAHYQNRDSGTVIRSYLFVAVRNRCLNKIAREKKFVNTIPDEPFLPEDLLESKEIYVQVDNALQEKVPPKSSAAFRFRHYDQMSHKEIAQEMNISIQTVKNQIGTAVKILRGYFRPAHVEVLLR